MGHLMIGDSKGNTRPSIQQLSAEFLTHGNHSMLAQLPVQMNRPGDGRDTELGHNYDAGVACAVVVDEMLTKRIEFSKFLGNGFLHSAEALETVGQVRQLDTGGVWGE